MSVFLERSSTSESPLCEVFCGPPSIESVLLSQLHCSRRPRCRPSNDLRSRRDAEMQRCLSSPACRLDRGNKSFVALVNAHISEFDLNSIGAKSSWTPPSAPIRVSVVILSLVISIGRTILPACRLLSYRGRVRDDLSFFVHTSMR